MMKPREIRGFFVSNELCIVRNLQQQHSPLFQIFTLNVENHKTKKGAKTKSLSLLFLCCNSL